MYKHKYQAIFLEEKPLLDYVLNKQIKIGSKDYELLVAIWLRRLAVKYTKKPHCIAFELKDELKRLVPNFDHLNPSHIKEVLEKHRKEGAHDIFLPEGTAANHKSEGPAFELKRFKAQKTTPADFIEETVNYIESFRKEYGKTSAVLMICPEPQIPIRISEDDAKELVRKLSASLNKDFPFDAVWLLGLTEEKGPYFTQYWPDFKTLY